MLQIRIFYVIALLGVVTIAAADESGSTSTRAAIPVKVGVFPQEFRTFYTTQAGLPSNDVRAIALDKAGSVVARTARGDVVFQNGRWEPSEDANTAFETVAPLPAELQKLLGPNSTPANVARAPQGQVAVGTGNGLFVADQDGARQVYPIAGHRSWAPTDVRVDFDSAGRLWFASYQGVGCLADGSWSLYTGAEGLPYDDLTAVACGPDGTVWFGTKIGAIRFDGSAWSYRQGPRWLPDDEVRDLVVDPQGNAWIATAGGISWIQFMPMTLAEKAKYYEDEIDKYHRRTEFGYVIEAHSTLPGDKSNLTLHTSDNDGLWTSMYGAGECFAYAATKDPQAKQRAEAAFRALKFLSDAPQGSPHPPPSGFIARSVLETTSSVDPNLGGYTLEAQRQKKLDDKYWRVYEPRWPKSADGRYYWKSDTSSDELDGHYFFYPLYYDLVAETELEKSRVREVVRSNIDHIISHDFSMHDHAGKTRWSVYGPQDLMGDLGWYEERGLNSVSILSYLNVAYHMTGDVKYREIAKQLRDKHSYHINAMWPKYQRGIGSGNQSDDEMAFMAFYNLIKYEPDPELKKFYTASFANSWRQEEPEMNPFFNFCFAALGMDVEFTNVWGTSDLSPWPSWLDDSIETLQRFPLDRFNWRHTNHHRNDLVVLTDHWADAADGVFRGKGYRNNLKVLPVDERSFNHWNTDPWQLDSGGDGRTMGCGSVFTLPYYMGLYHGFIAIE